MVATIGKYVDALYLSSSAGILSEPSEKLLDAAKIAAQESEDDVTELAEIPGVAGGLFYMKPHGKGKYQFVLRNARFYVEVSKMGMLPTLKIQPLAQLLYEYELTAVQEMAVEITRYFSGSSDFRLVVSRVDIAVDFQAPGFEVPHMADVVSRARDRYVSYQGADANAITIGKESKSLQAQLYNKSLELLKSDKGWMHEVWEASGYDPMLDVWRFELRFFREGLHSFGVDGLEDFINACGDLVRYALGTGEDPGWLRICDSDTRHYSAEGHSGRRSAVQWFDTIRSYMAESLPVQGLKRLGDNCRRSWDHTVKMAGAMIARASAILKSCGYTEAPNPETVGRLIGQEYRERLSGDGVLGWAEKVNQLLNEKRGEVWHPTIDYRIDYDPFWAVSA
ncbi:MULTISPECIES: hypothetical protein [Actinomycetota]|uniref:hypothetical protein n=1 Tax=Actinomycetota TaxID=201174 RepID=UPI00064B8C17|nr:MULTISPECIES: hypothetical protein [Actinomycetota]